MGKGAPPPEAEGEDSGGGVRKQSTEIGSPLREEPFLSWPGLNLSNDGNCFGSEAVGPTDG
jgi:hypothetical protein